MQVRPSRFLPTLLLLLLGACAFVPACLAGESSEEFSAAPQAGFEIFSSAVATSSVADGNYVLDMRKGAAWGRLRLENVSEFRAATRVLLSGASEAAGILFDYQGPNRFSAFLITGDGWYGIWEFDGTAYASAAGWKKDKAILPAGQWNTVAVTASAGSIRCAVNGREVLTLPHPAGTAGDIGVVAQSWASGHVSFDYLRACDLGIQHTYKITLASLRMIGQAGFGETFAHTVSIDGGTDFAVADAGTVLASGSFSDVRVVSVRVRTIGQLGAGVRSSDSTVQLALYSCEPGTQTQPVRVCICWEASGGTERVPPWAEWEYIVQATVD